MHAAAVLCLGAVALVVPLGPIYVMGVAAVGALLLYEQSLVSAGDLSRVKQAFDLNGYVGILYLLITAVAVYVRS
jgi:4-hydroxybenzoate polyprenyltransferase